MLANQFPSGPSFENLEFDFACKRCTLRSRGSVGGDRVCDAFFEYIGNDGNMRETDVVLGGTHAPVSGYGDAGKDCAFVLHGSGARTFAADCDPLYVLQAWVEGLPVAVIERVVSEIDMVLSSVSSVMPQTASRLGCPL